MTSKEKARGTQGSIVAPKDLVAQRLFLVVNDRYSMLPLQVSLLSPRGRQPLSNQMYQTRESESGSLIRFSGVGAFLIHYLSDS